MWKRGETRALARGMDTTPPFLPGRKEKRTGVAQGNRGIYRLVGKLREFCFDQEEMWSS